MAIERDLGQSRTTASVDPTDARNQRILPRDEARQGIEDAGRGWAWLARRGMVFALLLWGMVQILDDGPP